MNASAPRIAALPIALVLLGACDPSAGSETSTLDRVPLGKADRDDGSCGADGSDHCGGRSDGACWCDADCAAFGDCCHDVAAACTGPADPRLLIAGLDAPESIVFDPESASYFVSNLAHDILQTDPLHPPAGNVGYISRHDVDGSVIERRWAEGFSSPKGMAIRDGVLFVADPRAIVALDIRTGYELARHTLPEVGLFNDVAAAADGTLYVTDTANPGVYAIDPGSAGMRVVARDDRFEFLNGVAVRGSTVFVASTGILPSADGPGTDGRLFAIDPRSGDVREIEGVRGRWDGVAVLDEHHLALDDFMTGAIHLVDLVHETSVEIVAFPANGGLPFSGVADMGSAGSMLLVPSMFTNEIWTYTPAFASYE